MDSLDRAAATTTQTMPHHRMIRQWRRGLAEPVSAQVIDYVSHEGVWWRRSGETWTSVPDGPFALVLSASQARLAQARRNAPACSASTPPTLSADPWTAARNRRRSGGSCGKPPAFMPMRATDLRPHRPATCPHGSQS
jgi:hypothetical protein